MRYCKVLWLVFLAAIATVSTYAANGTFKADSVHFTSKNGAITFGGTLTLPETGKPCAAVIIVSGTGPQDQDGNMAGHKMFKTIAEYLSSRGVAVLRTDDRGVGKTTGQYAGSTTADFASDALAAVAYLKTRKEIDPKKIGLMGHSEGGAAISIAASQSKDVSFLISIAGLAMSGYDAQIRQNEDIVNASKLPDYDKKRSNDINARMFKTAKQYADSPNMAEQLMQTYTAWRKTDSVYFNTLNIKFDHFRFPYYSYIRMATGAWYRYFISYDAEKTMAKIKVPVLALNGDKDLMVACNENLANWKKYPAEGGHKDVTTVVLPGLNHLFLSCVSCNAQEYSTIKTEFSDQALQIISNWLKRFQ